MTIDDGIAAQIRSLANDPGNKHKRAADYLIRFLEQQDDDVETKRRKPHEATAYLLNTIAQYAMTAANQASLLDEENERFVNDDIESAIRSIKLQLETLSDHHKRTRADRRKTA